MIGFKHTFSASEAKEHCARLLNKVPEKYKPEVEQLYEWVTNADFIHALESNTKEQWEFCNRSMGVAPKMYIDKRVLSGKHGDMMTIGYTTVSTNKPVCRLCDESLAESIEYKTKHVVVSCPCGRMYCHAKCADDYLLKDPQCCVCKNYYIYDAKNSALKATIVNRR
jgi:hypothetical protein